MLTLSSLIFKVLCVGLERRSTHAGLDDSNSFSCRKVTTKMVWTFFSMALFLSLGVAASLTLGGFVYVLLALFIIVSFLKIIQDQSPLSESFHGNSSR